jgi:RND superfamily putative drug exporter
VVHRDPGVPDRSELPREERPAASHKHGLTARLARAIVWLRFVIVPAWVAAAVLASTSLPSLFEADTGELGNLLPRNSEALSVERRSGEIFAMPLLSHSLVVASQPGGLSARRQAAAARYVLAVDESANSTLRAVPLTNVPGLAAGPAGTTLVAFTYTDPNLAASDREEATHRFAAGLARATGVPAANVTGAVPASAQQTHLGEDWLPWLELATVLVVVAVLALYFRALGVPLLGLLTVGIAYICTSHVLGWAGLRYDVSIPQEVNPVIVALLFGILTDYVVFFVSGYRRRLADGDDSLQAVTETTAELLPVIATASLMIAGATLTLLASGVRFLSAFGPGNSVAVLIAAAVALTFVPAVLAIFGPRLLWPGRSHQTERPAEEGARGHIVGAAASHPAIVAALCVLVLAAAATGIREMELGNPVIRGLPASNPARRGYDEAARGFGPGIVGPTAVVLEGNGIAVQRGALADLQQRLSAQPGVGAVLGPADQPLQARYGAMLAKSGNAARYLLVLEDDPNGTEATATLANLESRLPTMLAASGLGAAKAGIAGDTAIAAELNDATQEAFLRIAPWRSPSSSSCSGCCCAAAAPPCTWWASAPSSSSPRSGSRSTSSRICSATANWSSSSRLRRRSCCLRSAPTTTSSSSAGSGGRANVASCGRRSAPPERGPVARSPSPASPWRSPSPSSQSSPCSPSASSPSRWRSAWSSTRPWPAPC